MFILSMFVSVSVCLKAPQPFENGINFQGVLYPQILANEVIHMWL